MMIVFVVVSTPWALLTTTEPPFLIVLSELALLYGAMGNLWQAEQMEQEQE